MQNVECIEIWTGLVYILAMLLLLAGCRKDNESTPPIAYLLSTQAGQITGQVFLYTDIPDDTLFFNYPSSGESRRYDINKDGTEDVRIPFSASMPNNYNTYGMWSGDKAYACTTSY